MENLEQKIQTELKLLINIINNKEDDVIIKSTIDKTGALSLTHTGNFKGFEIISKLSNALKAGGFLKEEDLDKIDIIRISEPKGVKISTENCDLSFNKDDNNIQTTFTPKGSPDKILADLKKAVVSAETEFPQYDKTWVKSVREGKIRAMLPPFMKSPSNWSH